MDGPLSESDETGIAHKLELNFISILICSLRNSNVLLQLETVSLSFIKSCFLFSPLRPNLNFSRFAAPVHLTFIILKFIHQETTEPRNAPFNLHPRNEYIYPKSGIELNQRGTQRGIYSSGDVWIGSEEKQIEIVIRVFGV